MLIEEMLVNSFGPHCYMSDMHRGKPEPIEERPRLGVTRRRVRLIKVLVSQTNRYQHNIYRFPASFQLSNNYVIERIYILLNIVLEFALFFWPGTTNI